MTLYRYFTLITDIADVCGKRAFIMTQRGIEEMSFEQAVQTYPRADVYRILENCVYADNTSGESLIDYLHTLTDEDSFIICFEDGERISMCKSAAIARYGNRALRWINNNKIGVRGVA